VSTVSWQRITGLPSERRGLGWQLAADTTICTGAGTTVLDLGLVSGDAPEIDLRLEAWGSFGLLVPQGVAVQLTGGLGSVRIEPLSPPIPSGPVHHVCSAGPGGLVRIRHPRMRERRRRIRLRDSG
jgi:hypothetical protein